MGNQIEDALKRIKDLKESAGYKEIEEYLLHKKESNYFFNDVINDGKIDAAKTDLRKFILKSYDSDFINPENLEEGKQLHTELKTAIHEFLGDDYVQIIFFETKSNYRSTEDTELFNLIFQKKFKTAKSGKIKILESEKCPTAIGVGEAKNLNHDRISIQLDLIHQHYFSYEGDNLNNQKVLLYGFNVEENPYLVKLFGVHPPLKIMNIIPISRRNSFFDNVD